MPPVSVTPPDPQSADRRLGLVPGSGAYARALVETIRQPLLVLDADAVVLSANPAFYRHFQVAREETVGRSLWSLGNGQWDVQALRRVVRRVLAERRPVDDFQVQHVFEHIGVRAFLVNARQVELEEERYRLVLVVFEDVTEQRRLTAELRRQARELERSNRDLQEFAHAASHDLQEPLRKVQAFADRFERSVERASLDERQRQYLESMTAAARRMQTRIDDLLRLARVSREAPRTERVELADVVGRVLADLEGRIEETGARIDVAPLPALEADPAQMELLLQNLLANALKYRRAGLPPRVRIGARTLEPADADARFVELEVADEGIGFDPVYADRIFQAFERLHPRGAYEGSGVGLSICRRIAELHGGSITADATPGEGARFRVRLPLSQSREHA